MWWLLCFHLHFCSLRSCFEGPGAKNWGVKKGKNPNISKLFGSRFSQKKVFGEVLYWLQLISVIA